MFVCGHRWKLCENEKKYTHTHAHHFSFSYVEHWRDVIIAALLWRQEDPPGYDALFELFLWYWLNKGPLDTTDDVSHVTLKLLVQEVIPNVWFPLPGFPKSCRTGMLCRWSCTRCRWLDAPLTVKPGEFFEAVLLGFTALVYRVQRATGRIFSVFLVDGD